MLLELRARRARLELPRLLDEEGENMAAETLTREAFADAPPEAKEKPQSRTGRTPPRDGVCKRCGLDKPVNRLMLCYSCFVITEIEDREKREGRHWTPSMAHPGWCHCELPGKHLERGGSANV